MYKPIALLLFVTFNGINSYDLMKLNDKKGDIESSSSSVNDYNLKSGDKNGETNILKLNASSIYNQNNSVEKIDRSETDTKNIVKGNWHSKEYAGNSENKTKEVPLTTLQSLENSFGVSIDREMYQPNKILTVQFDNINDSKSTAKVIQKFKKMSEDTIDQPLKMILPTPKAVTHMRNKLLKVIPKCCPIGELINNDICTNHAILNIPLKKLDFSELKIYTKDLSYTEKKVKQEFSLEGGILLNNSFYENAADFAVLHHNFYLTEQGILYQEVPNTWHRWLIHNTSTYCLDYTLGDSMRPVPSFRIVFEEEVDVGSPILFVTTGLQISSVFLALVLVVYALLPKLRNLEGKVQMIFVACLLTGFTLLATIQDPNNGFSEDGCKIITYIIYFFLMATFCWMNVMSCDIWWTFRGFAKARRIHRRGETFKLSMYCLYAFGVPLAMTVFLIVTNEMDFRHWPWFITPNVPKNACFLEGMQQFVYMYIPMLVLIFANWAFFLMTAFNIWRVQRSLDILNSAAAGTPAAHRQQKYRLLMYLKLSAIMGINWILEIVSWVFPQSFIITEGYNIMMGFIIFLILVCKRRVLRMLKIKFKVIKARVHSWACRKACLRRLFRLNQEAFAEYHRKPIRRQYTDSDSETSCSTHTTASVCMSPKGSNEPTTLLL